jgi:hypothetical protein
MEPGNSTPSCTSARIHIATVGSVRESVVYSIPDRRTVADVSADTGIEQSFLIDGMPDSLQGFCFRQLLRRKQEATGERADRRDYSFLPL